MKFLSIVLLILSIVFAEDTMQTQEQSVFGGTLQIHKDTHNINSNSEQIDENSTSENFIFNENNELEVREDIFKYLFEEVPFDAKNKQSNSIYANFINYPNTIYTFQRFALEIETIIATKKFTKIETRFLNAKDISIINPEKEWEKKTNNTYKNLYFLKVYTQEFQIPTIQIILYNEDEIVDVVYLNPKKINYTNIALKDEQFSNVIAHEVKILSSKTRQYSNNELLTVLEIEANYGNLEDFRLKEYKEQLLMSLDENYPIQKLIYNTIIPIHAKEIIFNYYDTQTNQFKKILIPIKLEEELVSTQTDLNPYDSNIEMYKKIALGILTIVFIIIYLINRKNIYIIIGVILSIIFFILIKPNNAMIIEENTKIYILPTNNSTVFYITPSKQIVEILNKKRHFTKILFKLNSQNTETVGWIKEKDIVED